VLNALHAIAGVSVRLSFCVRLCLYLRAGCLRLFVCGVNKRRLNLTVDALSIDKAGIDMGTNKKARTGLAHGLGLFVLFIG
jgi:hypothetical protein